MVCLSSIVYFVSFLCSLVATTSGHVLFACFGTRLYMQFGNHNATINAEGRGSDEFCTKICFGDMDATHCGWVRRSSTVSEHVVLCEHKEDCPRRFPRYVLTYEIDIGVGICVELCGTSRKTF